MPPRPAHRLAPRGRRGTTLLTQVLEAARQGFVGGGDLGPAPGPDCWCSPGSGRCFRSLALRACSAPPFAPALDPSEVRQLAAPAIELLPHFPSGREPSCGQLDARESATECPTRTRARASRPLPVAVVLGLLFRGDRGGASTRRERGGARDPAARRSTRRVHRPHDLLAPPGLARARHLLQRARPLGLDDRDDPAAAARLGVADRGRRPGRRAADRRPPRVAARQPGPRGRRAAVDRAAG